MRNPDRLRLVVLLSSLLSVSCENSCDPCPTARPDGLSTRSAVRLINAAGDASTEAVCEAGEQLVGGAYVFSDPFDPDGATPTVTGSYPAVERQAWIVETHSDRPGQMGTLLRVDAYCLRTSSLNLGVQVRSEQELSPANVVTPFTVRAPRGAVVLSGGYRMEYGGKLPPDLYNGYVLASMPAVESGVAVGWQVRRMYGLGPPAPRIRAYVLFATQNIEAGAPQLVDGTSDGTGLGTYAATALCAEDEFTVGGGYEIIGTPDQAYLIPHWVNQNVSFVDASAWRVSAVYGFQTDRDDKRSGLDAPTTARLNGSAVCLKNPRLPLCARITNPKTGSWIELDTSDPATKTQPVTLTGEAFLGKSPLPGSSLSWTVDGSPVGTGTTLITALPLPTPVPVSQSTYYHKFDVTLTATSGSFTATASIVLHTGRYAIP